MIGKTLLHYEIVSKLGQGGMGEVYKARDTHLDRLVALKILPAGRFAQEDSKRRFVQEARAASALNHPNIVTIHDVADAGDVTFIAMEYVPGQTLQDLIPRQGLPLPRALDLASQIAAGMARAHQAGIIHRDLKPANVVLGDDGRVRILDFGLAKVNEPQESDHETTLARSHETEEGTILGTVAYMSPEQAEGRRLDHRTDVFSFGVMLYEMLTGRRPFTGESRLETLSAILKQTPAPPSSLVHDLPRDLERLVERCLRKAADRRWQHFEDLGIALEDLKEESESGRLVSGRPAAERGGRRWPWIAAALAGGAALVGTALWRDSAPTGYADPVPVPLTAYAGDERDPAFSPDGSQVVFSWAPDGGITNTYLKLIGPGEPVRLTRSPYSERMSQWSPDGRWISFERRIGGETSFVVIPALGGPEREVRRANGGFCFWTPDSAGLTIADPDTASVDVWPLAGGERRSLLGPLRGEHPPVGGSIAPDGSAIAVLYRVGADWPLYVVPLGEGYAALGEPRALTPDDWRVSSFSWMPGSDELVFVRTITGNNLGGDTAMYRVALDGSPPRRVAFAGDNAWFLDVAPRGERLAYTRLQRDFNLYRASLTGDGALADRGETFASSSRMERDAAWSPDGSQVAFVSNRGGSTEIWRVSTEGERPVQLTESAYPLGTASPDWSPDGSRIAFVARAAGGRGLDLFVMPASGGTLTRLTQELDLSLRFPSWSRDGEWIYVTTGGSPRLWKVPSTGGAPVALLDERAVAARESPDGRWIYFLRQPQQPSEADEGGSLVRMPAGGGEVETLVSGGVVGGSLAVSARGVHYLTRGADGESLVLALLPLEGGAPRELGRLGTRSEILDASVSPDGTSVLYTRCDQCEADLMLVEGFR